MATGHVHKSAVPQAVAAQQATLDTLVGIATKLAGEQLTPMIGRLSAALGDISQEDMDPLVVHRRVKSGKLLKDNAYAYFHLVSTGLEKGLREAVGRLGPGAAQRAAPATLSLVPMEEMDNQLAFSALMRPFDIEHADALATLCVRLGLMLGRGVLRADSNPFRPEVFLKALDAAWREFEPNPEAHDLLQTLLRPELVFDFVPIYEELGAAVKRGTGQPLSVDAYRIQKTDDAAAARAARATAKAALADQLRKLFGDDGGDEGVPLIPDLPPIVGGTGGWRPSGATGFQPALAGQADAAAAGAPVAGAPMANPAGQPGAAIPGAVMMPAMMPAMAAMPGMVAVPAGAQPAPGVMPVAAGGFVPAAPGMPVVPMAGFVPAPGGDVAALAAGHAGPLIELLTRIDRTLQANGAGGAAAGAGGFGAQAAAPGQPSAAGAPADGDAASPHNVFYLPRFRQSLPKGSLPRSDERTLDLLARVFETVLLDENIPPQTRELLHVLQLPVLKAALLDKTFFFEEMHPARRLVDLLSRMGWEQRRDGDDTLLQAMKSSVARIDQEAKRDAFAAAVAELEASMARVEQAQEAALATPVASAMKHEKRAVATRAARDAVALRLGQGDVAEVVSGFLERRWTTVLTFAYSIEEEKPGAVGNATRTMDDLIWSVQPKPTQEQRKTLLSRLPRLISTLNKWLDAIKWQDDERLQFFARLAECHASIVRAPIEISPERQLELAVEAAQQDALRKLAMENAAAEQEAARREETSPLDALERGVWCEFVSGEERRKVKLAWVSPLRTLFIFSGAARREAFSMSAEKLAVAMRSGTIRVLAVDGVVGQVLSEAMQEGAVNDPTMAIPAIS